MTYFAYAFLPVDIISHDYVAVKENSLEMPQTDHPC